MPHRIATWFSCALLAAIVVIGSIGVSPQPTGGALLGANCDASSVGYPPLTDLGTGMYRDAQGGLYPGGSNRPPALYERAGVAHAQAIRPLNGEGQPDPAGAIGLLSIGMSNATMEFSAFKREADRDGRKNPHVVIVDGAQGGWDALRLATPAAPYWSIVDRRLSQAGVTPSQVQVAWVKEAIAGERNPFPADARRLQEALQTIVRVLEDRYPHLQIVYLSSRIYAGYAVSPLNPEPYAYESGFAVKWVIEERIQQQAAGPWVGWGPYLWTDGTRGRKDGLVWTCDDVGGDGTHPSMSGVRKVAALLLNFFTTDETAKPWFAAPTTR